MVFLQGALQRSTGLGKVYKFSLCSFQFLPLEFDVVIFLAFHYQEIMSQNKLK